MRKKSYYDPGTDPKPRNHGEGEFVNNYWVPGRDARSIRGASLLSLGSIARVSEDEVLEPTPSEDAPPWFRNNPEFTGARIVASTEEPDGYVSHFIRFPQGSAVVIDHPPTERWIVAGVFPGPRAAPGDIKRVKRRAMQQLERDRLKAKPAP